MQSLLIVPRSRPLACARGSLLPTVMCCLLSPGLLAAQASPEIREILDRIQRLEAQNRALADEVHQLRQELASAHGAANPISIYQHISIRASVNTMAGRISA